MNTKSIASWLSTAALLLALWLVGKAIYAGGIESVGIVSACLLGVLCCLWNPPATGAKA